MARFLGIALISAGFDYSIKEGLTFNFRLFDTMHKYACILN